MRCFWEHGKLSKLDSVRWSVSPTGRAAAERARLIIEHGDTLDRLLADEWPAAPPNAPPRYREPNEFRWVVTLLHVNGGWSPDEIATVIHDEPEGEESSIRERAKRVRNHLGDKLVVMHPRARQTRISKRRTKLSTASLR